MADTIGSRGLEKSKKSWNHHLMDNNKQIITLNLLCASVPRILYELYRLALTNLLLCYNPFGELYCNLEHWTDQALGR